MARYSYQAYDQHGRLTRGEIEAPTRSAALQSLHRQGRFALAIEEGAAAPADVPWWRRELFASRALPLADLAMFTRELATLVKANLALDEALRIVSLQPLMSARMRAVSRGVLDRVREGASLSGALAEGGLFPEHHWRTVQAGEASGALGSVLDELSGLIERAIETRRQVTSALLYPAILIAAAVGALVVIMGVLLPSIVPLFKDAGTAMPPLLQLMSDMREGFIGNWPVVLAVLALVVGGLIAAGRDSRLQRTRDRLLLRMPVVGALIRDRETARFSRTLSTLMRNGVPMLEAVRISSGVLRNALFADTARDAAQSLAEGRPLSAPLTQSGLFTELSLRLIAVGEQTGQLDTMLGQVATIYEATVQRQLGRLMSFLAPALTLAIGVIVGGLILSVMNAVLSVNDLVLK